MALTPHFHGPGEFPGYDAQQVPKLCTRLQHSLKDVPPNSFQYPGRFAHVDEAHDSRRTLDRVSVPKEGRESLGIQLTYRHGGGALHQIGGALRHFFAEDCQELCVVAQLHGEPLSVVRSPALGVSVDRQSDLREREDYSHSMVAGGFDEMS